MPTTSRLMIPDVPSYLPRQPGLLAALPGLSVAFDEERMGAYLQEALLKDGWEITTCEAGKGLYLPEGLVSLQYILRLRGPEGITREHLVNARVFSSRGKAEAYYQEKLEPLAVKAAGRLELEPFIHSIANLDSLGMSLTIFPVDGELPTLVDATDEQRLLPILRKALQARELGTHLDGFRLELAHYGRFNRCVLRYGLIGWAEDGRQSPSRVVYGKVYGDGQGEQVYKAMREVNHYLQRPGKGYNFRVPNPLAFSPEMRMILMDELPGELLSKRLLSDRLAGKSEQVGALSLEDSLEISARVLAALHASGLTFQRVRRMDGELAELRRETGWLQPFLPDLADWLMERLERIARLADETEETPLCPSHGDYRYTQLILSGTQAGLVDFDTVCQAEPALDLGQFLAIQRLSIDKDQDPDSPFPEGETERLSQRFIESYLQATYGLTGDPEKIRARTEVYELVSLFRLVLHSWQKLKGSRLKAALRVLEERIGWKLPKTGPRENKTRSSGKG